jgi:hypothetical protein
MRSGLRGLRCSRGQLSKLIHKVTHARARRADHVRERLLADFGDYRLVSWSTKSSSTRTVRAKRYAMNRGEKFGSSRSTRTMVALSTRVITESSNALAVETRRDRPVRQPSPIKSPALRNATAASLPCAESGGHASDYRGALFGCKSTLVT